MFSGARRLSRRSRVNRIAPLLGVAVLALVVSACAQATSDNPVPNFFPIEPATRQGKLSADLYSVIFWLAAAIFLLVEGLIFFAVFRYRRRRDDATLPKQTHGNLAFELAWTAIPFLIVVFLFALTMNTQFQVEAKAPNPDLTVDVTGFQWQWTFDYKEQGLSYTGAGSQGPEMVLPVGQIIHFRLHSNDVIHSFYVRDFFYKKDVVPGRTNEFDITIQTPGTYAGQCAEFCGLGHATMGFTVRAIPATDFQAWVTAEQAKAKATPTPAPSGTTAVKLGAKDITYNPTSLTAPADQPFVIAFSNNEAAGGPPHNVVIKAPDGQQSGLPLAKAGETVNYQFKALPAGTYGFFCIVHPNMQGTLTVK